MTKGDSLQTLWQELKEPFKTKGYCILHLFWLNLQEKGQDRQEQQVCDIYLSYKIHTNKLLYSLL